MYLICCFAFFETTKISLFKKSQLMIYLILKTSRYDLTNLMFAEVAIEAVRTQTCVRGHAVDTRGVVLTRVVVTVVGVHLTASPREAVVTLAHVVSQGVDTRVVTAGRRGAVVSHCRQQ